MARSSTRVSNGPTSLANSSSSCRQDALLDVLHLHVKRRGFPAQLRIRMSRRKCRVDVERIVDIPSVECGVEFGHHLSRSEFELHAFATAVLQHRAADRQRKSMVTMSPF